MAWYNFWRKPKPPAPVPTPTPTPVPVVGPLFGVATEAFAEVKDFETKAGKKVNLYSYYQSFFWDATFNTALAKQVHDSGAAPMITWEPWEPNGVANQPKYKLSEINKGTHDTIIKNWALAIKALGFPVYLRFAHEMNGDWYPWGHTNGNSQDEYMVAYKRVRLLFAAAGTTNVFWIWSPNVDFPLTPYYPGDDQVDFVAVDGYNWDTSSPEQVFGPTFDQIKAFTNKPLMIGETGCPEYSGKPKWIADFFTMVKNRKLSGFVWFNYNKEQNWRIDSSTAAQAAFKKGVNS